MHIMRGLAFNNFSDYANQCHVNLLKLVCANNIISKVLHVKCLTYIQDSNLAKVEDHTKNKPLCTTTTYVVSSSQTSPEYDMFVSVNINGRKTSSIVTVVRKASRRCVCQVFYQREGLNCWKITISFFPEYLLNVSTMYMYMYNTSDKMGCKGLSHYLLFVIQIAIMYYSNYYNSSY